MKRLTRSPKERFFDSLIRIILILAAILTLFPFLYVVMISLLSPAEYMSRGLVFPLRPTLNNYAMLFKWGTKIQNAYLVTIGTTVVGTAISLSATALLAYGLSRPALPGKSFVNGMLVLTMFFSGGLIPTYMVIKIIGLMNTYWALILPGSLSVWNVMVMRTFFKELPVELEGVRRFWTGAATPVWRSASCSRCPRRPLPPSGCSTRWATGTSGTARCCI